MAYDWKITLKKGVKYLCFYAVPWLISGFLTENPEMASLTVGTGLTMLANYLKHRRD
jgi:hypothetical protein